MNLSRRQFLAVSGMAAAGGLLPGCSKSSGTNIIIRDGKLPMNVLFIGVDDLRPELCCYGEKHVLSPCLDRFFRRSMLFERIYAQETVCSGARASLLTGCRPETTTVHDAYNDYFVKDFLPKHPSLPAFFHKQGYYTCTYGNLFGKTPLDLTELSEKHQMLPRKKECQSHYVVADNLAIEKKTGSCESPELNPFEQADVPDGGYLDGQMADEVLSSTVRICREGRYPWFLSTGFYRPHFPFNAPKRYWDMYDRSTIPLPPSAVRPAGAPDCALHSDELARYKGGWGKDGASVTPDQMRLLRHGYFASVSYVDSMLGKLINVVEGVGQLDNTVIVVWSDHGYHLGEQGLWGSGSLYEHGARSSMLIYAPGVRPYRKCRALVELVDIFPTLVELTGMSKPTYLEGTSFVPLMKDHALPWKKAAFSERVREDRKVSGFSIRTDRYRFTEWREGIKDRTGAVVAQELYDYESDPDETTNIASANPELTAQLTAQLNAGWRAALPTA